LQLSQNAIPTKEYLILRGSILQFDSEPKQEEEGGGRGSVKLSSSVGVVVAAVNGLLFWHPPNVAHPTQRCNSRMKQRMLLIIMTVKGMHHSTNSLPVFPHLVQAPFCLPTSRSSSILSSHIPFTLIQAPSSILCEKPFCFPTSPSSFLYEKPFLFSHIPFQAPSISP
jgi:hypothetical protein